MSHAVFRPPAEFNSLILRVADGCPWNRCTFCAMYTGVTHRPVPRAEWLAGLEEEKRFTPRAPRVFLADGDVMALPFDKLQSIVTTVRDQLPRVRRVSMYANGASILKKTPEQLRELKSLGVHTLYLGLESGDDETLRRVNKRETAEDMVAAVQLAQGIGFRLSVMVLIGLGGQEHSTQHVAGTISALNDMQPRLLSFLRIVPVPGTELAARQSAGEFSEVTEYQAVSEIRYIIKGLELTRTIFRADHVSNIVPLEGRFPADKQKLLSALEQLLDSNRLDQLTPGPRPAYL